MSGIRADKASFSTYSKASLVLLPLLGLVGVSPSASAQVVSAGEGPSIVDKAGNRFNITGGQLSSDDANLFHNFEQFDLSAEQVANFETIPNVQNVFGRVGGAQASAIDGTLQVSGSDANLYLMNPAGVLIGPNAQLNLSGGFAATTATGIGFENGQWDEATNDYGQLTGEPATFRFASEQAGAVVNTGELSVGTGKSIGLIGGTAVSTGRLNAPGGTVTMAAVEGSSLVRISQGNRLLSLEVEPLESTQPGESAVTAQSIGSMLTGGGLSDATALIAEPDGTVRLGNATIDESGGSAIASGSISTLGEVGGDINVLGDRVSLLDASLDASGNSGGGLIRVGGDYQGDDTVISANQTLVDSSSKLLADALEMGDGGKVIIWSDNRSEFYGSSSGRGGPSGGNGGFVEISGERSLTASGSVDLSALQGEVGTVLLDPENLVITDGIAPPDTATTAYLSSSYVEGLSNNANVNLAATNDFTIEDLSDNQLLFRRGRSVTFTADSDGDLEGEFVMQGLEDSINAERGNISIFGAGITAGHIAADTTGTNGKNGGDVALISSQGIAVEKVSTNVYFGGNNAGNGGDIDLRASNSIRVGNLNASSTAGNNSSGRGGQILLRADTGSVVVAGDIISESRAGKNNAEAGGDITIEAADRIEVAGRIDTSSTANNANAGSAGDVSLTAANSVSVKDIAAISSRNNSDGNIFITGDRIDFGNGPNSVQGSNVAISPYSITRDINIGSNPNTLFGLDITSDELAAIGRGVANIAIGRADGTGNINLSSGFTSVDSSERSPVDVLGGGTLIGSNSDTTYLLRAAGSGEIIGSGSALVRFQNILNLQGGSEDDTFTTTSGITNSSFSSIDGGGGANIFDYTDFGSGELDLTGLSNLKIVSRSNQPRALRGGDLDNIWQIYGPNAGSISNASGTLAFEGASTLTGGSEQDRFVIESSGEVEQIRGGDATDILDYSGYANDFEVDLASATATGVSAFSSIEAVVGNDSFGSLIGYGVDGAVKITGDRNGTINNEFTFEKIARIDGGGSASITLDLSESGIDNRWIVDGKNSGSANGLAFQNIRNLLGGDSDDNVSFAGVGSITGVVNLGDGANTLDYSGYNKGVEFDLDSYRTTGLRATGLPSLIGEITTFVGSQFKDTLGGTQNPERFEITGDRAGRVGALTFSDIETIDGGAGGGDTLDYSTYSGDVSVNLASKEATGLSKFSEIEAFVGSISSELIGPEQGSHWKITGVNEGSVQGQDFTGFSTLVGGSGDDVFSFENDGVITGSIAGAEENGQDVLNYRNYSAAVDISLASMSVENSLASFSGIEKVVGSETFTDTLTGRDRRNNWTIDGTNRGAVTFDAGKDIAFENISSAVGGSEDDIFSFISDGVLEGSIDGRGDSNQLDYSQYAASSIDIYPNAVVSNRSTTTQFSDIQDVVGTSSSRDTIQGLRDDDVFVVSADGSISIGGLSVTAIEAVEGNEGKDRLDYSDFGAGITVDLQRGQVNNLRFSSIEDFLSGTFEDTLVGTDANELFEISGVGTASNSSNRIVVSAADPDGNLSFVGFDILNGGAGDNTFSIASAGNPNIRVEGSSDDISSQNRLISDAANAQWQLSGKKNAGRLIGESGTLAEFVQIQNLENIGSGQHRVVFTEPASQITGSISSGGSSLVLQGDDINIGRDDGTGNAIGGRISGTGELTILPGTSGVGIELGGTDSRGPQLNFTGGELEAIRGGFERVTFGDRTTGSIRFKDDVRLSNSVALRSQADIDLNNHQLLSNGSIETESDRILGNGKISSKNDRVVLSAERDIAVGTVTAGGGRAIDIASRTGGLSVNGELNAGRVGLSASENIAVSGNISTGGGDRNNSVSISSTSGTLQTAGISTNESSQDETNTNSPAGDVDLKARGSIDIGFIDARSDSTASGSIQVETNENFTATGYIPETTLSLATAPSSRIDILYGNPMRMERPFLVGAASANGTVGRARADIEIESGDVLSGQPQGNISVVDRGFRLPEPREQIAPLKVSNPTLEMASSSSGNAVIVDSNSDREEAIASIENSLGGGFDEYLALPTDGRTQVTTLRNMQQILSDVEQTTETTPALVYVYFVPDAASEEAIKASGDRTAQPDDQLEVMLVTQTGNPIRKRQWGITREQVEAVSREFRQQITSQFSTAQRYLKPAQQLYDWMLRPIAADLTEQHVESLGFVMDTGLRTLPIAALHDGDQYLVENYSLGLLPTFSLTEFQSTSVERVDFETAQVLAMGASKFTDQPDLPAVDAEMAMIANQQWAGDSFLNEEFVLKNLRGQLEKKDYGIVHLATHASFESGDLNNSYIQMWDEKLSLSDVKELGLERSNVGMIVLSACNTALGDRASEYGFAGFAVTSGSQSALASLWPVNDEGTLGFMSQFYGALKQAPVRAEALRRAQRSLIDGEVGIDDGRVYGSDGEAIATLPTLTESGRWNFSHPFFWSAFTMVGNPW